MKAGWVDVLSDVASVRCDDRRPRQARSRKRGLDGASGTFGVSRTGDRLERDRETRVPPWGSSSCRSGMSGATHDCLAPAVPHDRADGHARARGLPRSCPTRSKRLSPSVTSRPPNGSRTGWTSKGGRSTRGGARDGRPVPRPDRGSERWSSKAPTTISGGRSTSMLERSNPSRARADAPGRRHGAPTDAPEEGRARAPRRALATFDALGAPLWVDKAQRELARIGGRAPSPHWAHPDRGPDRGARRRWAHQP